MTGFLYTVRGILPVVTSGTLMPLITPELFGDATIAVSLRRLISTYAGSAARLRRDSDNTEQDIGFDASGNFDSTSAASFIGGANGFLVTWYNQVSGGVNGTNATAANQLKYVASGIGGKPGFVCPDTEERYVEWRSPNTFNAGPTQYMSGFAVAYVTAASQSSGRLLSISSSANDFDNGNGAAFIFRDSSTQMACYYNNNYGGVCPQTDGSSAVFASVFDGSNSTMYKNGVGGTPVAQTSSSFGGTNVMSIGRNINVSQSNQWNGGVSEVIVWFGVNKSVASVNSNMQTYYGI